jgi:hypothetical protein
MKALSELNVPGISRETAPPAALGRSDVHIGKRLEVWLLGEITEHRQAMNLNFLRRSGGKARDELRQNDSAGGKLHKRAARQAEKIGQSKNPPT